MLDSQVMLLTEKTSRLVRDNLSFFVADNDNELFLKKFSELMIFIRIVENKVLKNSVYNFRYNSKVRNIFSTNIPSNEELEFMMISNPVLELLSTEDINKIAKNYDCSYLKPTEHLQIAWMKKINGFKVENSLIKVMLHKSSVCIQKTLINYDYFDLYKVTHGIFFASDFGNNDIGVFLDLKQINAVKSNLFMDLNFSLKSRHGDLAGELLICIICLKNYLTLEEEQLLVRLLDIYIVNEAIPFLDSIDDVKKNPNTYHYVLVLGMMGKIYEKYFKA